MPKLTQRLIEAAKAGDRDVYVWDSEVRGFGLRIKATGTKSFIISLRIGGRGGQQRRRLLGKPSIISVEKARQQARLLVADAKSGHDPIAEQIAQRQKKRLREVVTVFLAEHVQSRRKPSYARECGRIFDRHILPNFGTRPISDLTRPEVTRWHHDMRETPYQANRCLAILSKLLTWSMRHGYRDQGGGNPCQYIEKFPERKRERYLSSNELQRLASAFVAAQQAPSALEAARDPVSDTKAPDTPRPLSPYAIAAIRLLLFTGARRDEIRTLRWQHVDLERRALFLPDSKTGQKTILLSTMAVALLAGLPRLEDNPFVFPGGKAKSAIADVEKPWQQIRRQAKLDDVRLHDLRHTFASIAAGSGQSLPIIGKLLVHSQASTTARYAHIAANPARQAIDDIGERMLTLLQPSEEAECIAA